MGVELAIMVRFMVTKGQTTQEVQEILVGQKIKYIYRTNRECL